MAETFLDLDCEVRFGPGTVLAPRLRIDGAPGKITLLFGPSGCGKTTCLRLLAGLLRPDSGRVATQHGIWSDAASGVHLPPQHRRIGFVFQNYALFSHRTVRQNIGYALAKMPRPERQARVAELAALLEIESILDHATTAISGGQAQRVALARALAPQPDWLFLDEPLSALDEPLRQRLGKELRERIARLGIPTVMVTHDRREIELLGDELVVLANGKVLEQGAARELVQSPQSTDCARTLGFENIIAVRSCHGAEFNVQGTKGEVTLTAAPSAASKKPTHLAIRAEQIHVLASDAPPPSDSNIFEARLEFMHPLGPLMKLHFFHPLPLEVVLSRNHPAIASAVPGATCRLAIPHGTVCMTR